MSVLGGNMKIGNKVRVIRSYSSYGHEWFRGKIGVLRVVSDITEPDYGVEFKGNGRGHLLMGLLSAADGWYFAPEDLTVVRKTTKKRKPRRTKKKARRG
jgi:hypothetical protein